MRIRTRRRRTPAVPIIPLLDILVILLIFFMLTTTFPEKREALMIDLPKVSHLPSAEQADRRVVLEIDESGELRLAGAAYDLRGLGAGLEQMKEALPEAKLELKADEGVSLQLLLEVWEILTVKGFPIREVPVRVQVQVE